MLFATSCKDSVNAPENVELGENQFLVSIDNGAVPQNAPAVRGGKTTMTTIDPYHRVFWEENDGIFINGVYYKAIESGDVVIFEPGNPSFVAEGTEYHAFYCVGNPNGNSASLPMHQSFYGEGKVSNLPMYAFGNSDRRLTFHNICSVLKIAVPEFAAGADKIVISSDQQMNGSFTVDENFKAVMTKTVGDLNEDDKKVEMETLWAGVKFQEGDEVYIAVPAQEYTNFKVEFLDGETLVSTKIF